MTVCISYMQLISAGLRNIGVSPKFIRIRWTHHEIHFITKSSENRFINKAQYFTFIGVTKNWVKYVTA
jgi:hypothetical protein